MKKLVFYLSLCFALASFTFKQGFSQNESLHKLFSDYYEDRLKLNPSEATSSGDNRYNDQLPNTGSAQYIRELGQFYDKYLAALKKYNRGTLNLTDRTSFDLLEYVLKTGKEALTFHPEYIPATQFRSLALTMGTWGAGGNIQPFKTVNDYNDWLKRIDAFTIWVDTAIANFNKGIAAGVVLPRPMVMKMIPQMERLAETDSSKNIFYGPVRNFPKELTIDQKQQLLSNYHTAITSKLVPSYTKLASYLKNTYLPNARSTSGYNALPNGAAMYAYFVRTNTTTNKTPEEIYQIGLREVDKIHAEMEKVKKETGFKGSLPEFYTYLTKDPKFLPFKTAEEVLEAYRAIQRRIDPNLNKLFSVSPKTPFEIRQTEAFRAASAAAQYFPGTPDGKRPGIFYAPIIDATTYPYFSMEDLFIHEAIPGHHYQLSLQSEDTTLPVFRRNTFLTAFGEGWALYAETLGKELGVYTDPYQYMGSLQNQIHRAIRLVVDVGLHTGKMTREEAIKYMLGNEPITEQSATAEIERYMSLPGQALSYKIGQLKIEELRDKYKKQLGTKFSLKTFHDAVLKAGSLPLSVLEGYMDEWAAGQVAN
ncbi:MAG: DUF885 domain-containing protein [Chitinophagaceae bacterium]|nr:DUF885 domain-containing protein [Chitinophagaceae bacterium]